MHRWSIACACLVFSVSNLAAQALLVRKQAVGDVTYFHVRVPVPAGWGLPPTFNRPLASIPPDDLAFMPRLVPAKLESVVVMEWPMAQATAFDFFGRTRSPGVAKFVLRSIADQNIEIDLTKALAVAVPPKGDEFPIRVSHPDDLESRWASAWANDFFISDRRSGGHSYCRVARNLVARRYGVADPMPTAVPVRTPGTRNVELVKLPTVPAGNQPWQRLLTGRKPDMEPVAAMIPLDQAYLRIATFDRLPAPGDPINRLEQALPALIAGSGHDARLRERYQAQLCLPSSPINLNIFHDVTVTVRDLSFGEGADFTVILRPTNVAAFKSLIDIPLGLARRQNAGRMRESKASYHGVEIESYVTPDREISLHRAFLGVTIVCSNSPVSIRRVIDAAQKRLPSIADSQEFRLFRSIYPANQPEDISFFLTETFMQQWFGPETRIRMARRAEARACIERAQHAALFARVDGGRWPRDLSSLAQTYRLPMAEIVPLDGTIHWDPATNTVISDVYGTVAFSTPLVEMAIDRVTPDEEKLYRTFRGGELAQWQKFLAPIGVRATIGKEKAKVEAFAMPSATATHFAWLYDRIGDGYINIDPADLEPPTLAHLSIHISPEAPERGILVNNFLRAGIARKLLGSRLDWAGDDMYLHVDSGPGVAELMSHLLRPGYTLPSMESIDAWRDEMYLLAQAPVSAGIEFRRPLIFVGLLTAARKIIEDRYPGLTSWETQRESYRGAKIHQVIATPAGVQQMFGKRPPPGDPLAIDFALVNSHCVAGAREVAMKRAVSREQARRTTPPGGDGQSASLYVAPSAAGEPIRQVWQALLENENRRIAFASAATWEALYRSGALKPSSSESTAVRESLRHFGFVAAAPDGSGFRYDARTDETLSKRFGSPRRPSPTTGPGLGSLIDVFAKARLDLKLRDDGVQATLDAVFGSPAK